MGSKRSKERMERLRLRLYEGMAERGITGETADIIFDKLAAFASYGFPESHSVSFAYLVYASAYIKLHHPAAFLAALLNAQPMGFWAPQTLVADARRHGVEVRGVDLNASDAVATLEPTSPDPDSGACDGTCDGIGSGRVENRRNLGRAGPAVRLGLEYVRHLGADLAREVAAGRPYESMEDLARRVPALTLPQLEALATAGAFGCFDRTRREALWSAGAVSQSRPGRLEGIVTGERSPTLPGMSDAEQMAADLWATGISPDSSPTELIRPHLDSLGVVTAAGLMHVEPGSRVLVGGIVTHRQRPATAGGTTFVNLEDETGLVNVVCAKPVWDRYKQVTKTAPAWLVRGRLERNEGAINLIAERIEALSLSIASTPKARNFR
jgi:error-prone DNA polymerase